MYAVPKDLSPGIAERTDGRTIIFYYLEIHCPIYSQGKRSVHLNKRFWLFQEHLIMVISTLFFVSPCHDSIFRNDVFIIQYLQDLRQPDSGFRLFEWLFSHSSNNITFEYSMLYRAWESDRLPERKVERIPCGSLSRLPRRWEESHAAKEFQNQSQGWQLVIWQIQTITKV